MFILKSSSAAHGFIDIARCTIGNPHLVDVIEANAPFARRNRRALERHVERVLGAAEVIAAACHEPPRKGMPVPIDVRDPAIHAALVAMLDLYLQFTELGDTAGYCADAIDVAEIRMTIQAGLDEPAGPASPPEAAPPAGTARSAPARAASPGSATPSSLVSTSV